MNNNISNKYSFYAFISYSRKNEKYAKWLQKKLESYRLPAVLQKQHTELPKKIKIFRDKTDIGVGGSVENALSRELSNSKKLIVICSPDSAKSEYVEYEIQSFLKLGRNTDDILPFIIEGKVDRLESDNCYTPTLNRLNLNGADAVKEGKNTAFIRLLSSLLEIKYDELKRREHIRFLRKCIIISILSFIFLTILSLFLWYIIPHTKQYENYITHWGIPVGINEIKKNPNYIPHSHYSITYQYNRPIKLIYEDIYGKISNEQNLQNDTFTTAEYFYEHLYNPFLSLKNWKLKNVICSINPQNSDEQKEIDSIKMQIVYDIIDENNCWQYFYYDSEGAIPKSLSPNILTDINIYYNDFPELMAGVFGDQNFDESIDKKLLLNNRYIYRHKVEYNQNGLEIKKLFYNNYNQPVTDENGILGFINIFNEQEQLLQQSYLYEDYNDNSSIVAYKKFTYTEDSHIQSIGYYKKDIFDSLEINTATNKNNLINNTALGYAYMEISRFFDAENNLNISYSFFNDKKEPVFEKSDNASNIQDCFNIQGELLKETLVKKDCIECLEYSYNSQLKCEEIKVYLNNKLSYKAKLFYNETGQKEKYELYDEDNNISDIYLYYYEKQKDGTLLITIETENLLIKNEYDKYGRHIMQGFDNGKQFFSVRIVYEGLNCSLCYYLDNNYYSPYLDFYARADFTYNSTGLLQNVLFRDEKGNKITHPLFGFAEYSAICSNSGILRHEDFKNENGQIVDSKLHNYACYDAELDINDKYRVSGKYILKDGKTLAPSKLHFEKVTTPFSSDLISQSDIIIQFSNAEGKIEYWNIYKSDGNKKYLAIYNRNSSDGYKINYASEDGLGKRTEYHNNSGDLANRPNQRYSIQNYSYYDNGDICVSFISADYKRVGQLYKNRNGKTYRHILYDEKSYTEFNNYDDQGRYTTFTKFDLNNNIIYSISLNYYDNDICTWNIKKYDKEGREINSIINYQGNIKINNEDGWAHKFEKYFDENKRTIFLNSNDEILFYKSKYIIKIDNIENESFAMQNNIHKDDIILVLGNFEYFSNGTASDFTNDPQNTIKQCIIYSQDTKTIKQFYSDYYGMSFNYEFPTDSEDTSYKYIKTIKSIYDNWRQDEKK